MQELMKDPEKKERIEAIGKKFQETI